MWFDFLPWREKEKPAMPAPVKVNVDVLLERKVAKDAKRTLAYLVERRLVARQHHDGLILSPIIDAQEHQGG